MNVIAAARAAAKSQRNTWNFFICYGLTTSKGRFPDFSTVEFIGDWTGQRPWVGLSLACGPAAEVFDILAHRDFAKSVQFHMIDVDDYAMEFLDRKATEIGVRESLTLHRANVFRLSARRELGIPPIDFAYSLGLIDYFDDRHVKSLIRNPRGIFR